MTTHQPLVRSWPPALRDVWRVSPATLCWWTAYGLLQAIPFLLVARRAAGAFQQPLSTSAWIVTVLITVGVIAAMRAAGRAVLDPSVARTAQRLVLGAFTLSGLILLLAISLPDAPLAGTVVAWSCLAATEAAWWARQGNGSSAELFSRARAAPDVARSPARESLSTPEAPAGNWDEPLPADVLQRLLRTRGESGGESLWGAIRVEFAPGELRQAVHVAFCPPWPLVPEFHVEPAEGPECEVEVTQLAAYGVRMEIKLTEPASDAVNVVLQFEALGPPDVARRSAS